MTNPHCHPRQECVSVRNEEETIDFQKTQNPREREKKILGSIEIWID